MSRSEHIMADPALLPMSGTRVCVSGGIINAAHSLDCAAQEAAGMDKA